MHRTWIIAAIALVCVPSARADDGPNAQAGDALPTLTFQADPSGKGAKLKAGFDARFGLPISTIVSPFFEGSTDNGAADLFVLDSKSVSASSNWNVGAVVSFLHWPALTTADRDAAGNSPAYQKLLFFAYQECNKYCGDPKTKEIAGSFCKKRDEVRQPLAGYSESDPKTDPILTGLVREAADSEREANDADATVSSANDTNRAAASTRAKELHALANARRAAADEALDERASLGMSIDDICPTQRPALDSYLRVHYDAWSSVPTHVFQLGLSVGATVNKYLDPGASDELTLRNRTHSSQTVGAMLIRTIPHWSLEAPLVAKRKFELATTDTAKWCVPAGQVGNESGMASNAETCQESPIGPLRRHYSVDLAAFVSRLSPSNFWRIGLGPVLSFSPKANGCGSFMSGLDGSKNDHLTSLSRGRRGGSGLGTTLSV